MTLPIVTFTPNPALDLSTGVGRLEDGVKLRCEAPRRDPGGGGINAARVIRELGGDAIAVRTSGGLVGELLEEELARAGLRSGSVRIGGATRESFSVHERDTGRIYRFVLPGPELTPAEWDACVVAVTAPVREGALVLLSGSLPPGVEPARIGELADAVRDAGGRLLVDMAGDAMRAALRAGVFLARFNRPEFEELVGRPMPDHAARMEAAARMVEDGAAEAVVATVGADGALLVTADERLHLPGPRQPFQGSPVGAGDSLMGALTLGLAWGWRLEDACRLGVVAAVAARLTEGTQLCRRSDVLDLYADLTGGAPPAPLAP